MPIFTATYTTRAGQTRQLQLQAADAASAKRDLRRRGIVPTGLQTGELKTQPSPQAKPSSNLLSSDLSALLEAKPGIRDKALFANKLAALVDAGVPIVRSLDLVAGQQRMPLFKRALTAVSQEVSQGGNLGGAMRRWPKVFDKLTIAMVAAGEPGGGVEVHMRRLR